jgi:hypothetical protein
MLRFVRLDDRSAVSSARRNKNMTVSVAHSTKNERQRRHDNGARYVSKVVKRLHNLKASKCGDAGITARCRGRRYFAAILIDSMDLTEQGAPPRRAANRVHVKCTTPHKEPCGLIILGQQRCENRGAHGHRLLEQRGDVSVRVTRIPSTVPLLAVCLLC